MKRIFESIQFHLNQFHLSFEVLMLCAPTSFNRVDTLHKLDLCYEFLNRMEYYLNFVQKSFKPLKDLFLPSCVQEGFLFLH